jgi:hypothetical protein
VLFVVCGDLGRKTDPFLSDFLQAQGITSPLPTAPSNDGRRASNARKRKRSFDEVKPEVGPSKALHADNQTGAMRDFLGVEIKTEEGFEILRALRVGLLHPENSGIIR